MEIPNFDIGQIFNMIWPIVQGILKGIASFANSIGTAIFPSQPQLAIIGVALIGAFLLKDKLSGGLMFIILAILIWLIASGSVAL